MILASSYFNPDLFFRIYHFSIVTLRNFCLRFAIAIFT